MAGLLFWGVTLRESKGDRKAWNKAVADFKLIYYVLSFKNVLYPTCKAGEMTLNIARPQIINVPVRT